MKDLKYTYLQDKTGKLTHINESIKGECYYLEHTNIEFIVRDGELNRKHYALKNSVNSLSLGGGESVEHYNAKMQIVYESKYYDDIFKTDVFFSRVISEKKINNKIPDLSCYDENDNLVMLIEIKYTNKKYESDIIELRKIGIPVVEIDINNENKCKHIILPTLLENNRQRFREIKDIFSRCDKSKKQELIRFENEFKRVREKFSPDFKRYEDRIHYFKESISGDGGQRIEKINTWLQKRIERFKYRYKNYKEDRKRVEDFREGIYKLNYRIGKIEREIKESKLEYKRIEREIKDRKKDIEKNAECFNVEWVKPKWMKSDKKNNLSEIRYFCS